MHKSSSARYFVWLDLDGGGDSSYNKARITGKDEDMMTPATDFRVYQRNQDGFAQVLLAGKLPEHATENMRVMSRVCREDDGQMVVAWTACEIKDGSWQVVLRVPQGGLYQMETSMGAPEADILWSERIQNICHVGVGELFMIAGQSNMAGYGRDTAYDPPQLGVHLYGNNGKWSIAMHPLNDSIDTIYPENREMATGTSPGLAFAKAVQRALHVPVGLIQASLGGSPLSRWDLQDNGDLARAMFRRMDAVGDVGGVIWYQGCSDTNNDWESGTYLERFTRMVADWRGIMGDVPFVTVQLNRWTNGEGQIDGDEQWGKTREAQRQAARTIPGVYIVSASDFMTSDSIHTTSGCNVILGERMASVYLNKHHGLPGQIVPDVEKVVRTDDTHLMVYMTPGSCVVAPDGRPQGLDAEDENGLIACTEAKTVSEGILLTLERPCSENVRLHMLWRTVQPAFMPHSIYGMPVLSCYGVAAEKA